MRRKKRKVSREVMQQVNVHYQHLAKLYHVDCRKSYEGRTYYDIFVDTIEFIISDPLARDLDDDAFLQLFDLRYNLIRFRIIKQIKTKPYADYLQAKEEQT